MIGLLTAFEARVHEVRAYFRFLEVVLEPDAQVFRPHRRTYRRLFVSGEAQKTVKASALLLLYNLTESTIRLGVGHIYEAIGRDRLTYDQVRDEVQQAWIDYRTKHLTRSFGVEKVRKTARDLVEAVVRGSPVEIEEVWLGRSTNIDARRIREIAKWLGFAPGFSFESAKRYSLKIVKDKRNDLAHGIISFGECGGEFTASDLVKIEREVVSYLRGVVRNIERYVDARGYVRKSRSA